MSFSVSQIVVAARRNPALLTSETAAYIVLSLVEQSQSSPRRVTAEHALIHSGGAVTLGEAGLCDGVENARALRQVLAQLLQNAAPGGAVDALLAVATGRTAGGPEVLRAELQSALVPLNRAAARRALSRLHRKLTADAELWGASREAPPAAHGVSTEGLEASSPRGNTGAPRAEGVHYERAGFEQTQLPAAGAEGAGQTRPPEPTPSADIPVEIEETQFRAQSILSGARGPNSDEGVSVSWYPAQTTPRQFRDDVRFGEHGTPILGSVEVVLRDVSAPSGPAEPQESVAPGSGGLLSSSGETNDANASADSLLLEDWSDTVVDTQIDQKCGERSAPLPRRVARRSNVEQLVERISVPPYAYDQARKGLLDMAFGASEDHEFHPVGTVTPPPVANSTTVASGSASSRRGPRRIVLSALTMGLALVGAWIVRPAPGVGQAAAQRSSDDPCEARVHVDVPEQARVYLNDAIERTPQNGPLARFEGVRCEEPAELTVQLPSPAGSPLPDAWVRMPLPETELRIAAASGEPLLLLPFGDAPAR